MRPVSNHNPADGPLLPCGCSFRNGESDPRFPCRDASRLLAARQFARLLATGSPCDLALRRAVTVADAALAAHYRCEAAPEHAAAAERRAAGQSQ